MTPSTALAFPTKIVTRMTLTYSSKSSFRGMKYESYLETPNISSIAAGSTRRNSKTRKKTLQAMNFDGRFKIHTS